MQSELEVTPLKTSSPSPIKITTPQSWQITSTPTSIKRSVSEIEDSHVPENSSYHHGRMKRKCVRSLKFAEHSSQTQSDSSWSETSTSGNTSILSSPTVPHICTTKFKRRSRQRVREVMESDPRTYLGIDRDWLSVLSLISSKFKVNRSVTSLDGVYLVLRKIRLNESFAVLGHEFGISKSVASRYFKRFLPFIADHFTELIDWPTDEAIHRAMSIGFRKSFKNVTGVGDCLEISIQKPIDAFEQALTWSDYKKGNTLKYYVVISPNGLFMFCSACYGGRTTDEVVVSHCGFLDLLKKGMVIMLDRGFKKVYSMLLEKGCDIVRPPSVSEGKQLSKEQVLTGRKIAGVRIHVERAIRRIREFKFLGPHACIQHSLIKYADAAMSLVCGLINLQSCLTRC